MKHVFYKDSFQKELDNKKEQVDKLKKELNLALENCDLMQETKLNVLCDVGLAYKKTWNL